MITDFLSLKDKPCLLHILGQLQIKNFWEEVVGLGPGVDHHGVHGLHYLNIGPIVKKCVCVVLPCADSTRGEA